MSVIITVNKRIYQAPVNVYKINNLLIYLLDYLQNENSSRTFNKILIKKIPPKTKLNNTGIPKCYETHPNQINVSIELIWA